MEACLKSQKVRPNVRGTVWELFSGERVVVLKTLKAGYVQVMNERNKLETKQESQFRLRVEPPVSTSL